MPRAFFEALIESGPQRERARRASVLPLSVVLHAGGLSALLVLPLLAQEGLPDVPSAPVAPIVPYVHVVTPRPPRAASAPPATGVRAPAPHRPAAPVRFLAPIATPAAIEPEPDADFLEDLGGVPGVIPGVFGDGGGGVSREGDPGAGTQSGERAPVLVGGDIRPPRKLHHVDPIYPPVARSARVQGVVILRCTLSAGGRVTGIEVLRSPPFLADSAAAAVSQWLYEPTHLNGQPVPVVMTVTVTFRLR